MKVRILWVPKAEAGLDEALAYIALDNPEAAAALLDRVLAAVQRAAEFPKSGRRIPELPKEVARELVVPPLRVFYELEGKALTVLGVMRAERGFDPTYLA